MLLLRLKDKEERKLLDLLLLSTKQEWRESVLRFKLELRPSKLTEKQN